MISTFDNRRIQGLNIEMYIEVHQVIFAMCICIFKFERNLNTRVKQFTSL